MLLKDAKIQFTLAHDITGIDVNKKYDLLSIENSAYGVICDNNVLLYVPKNKYGEKVFLTDTNKSNDSNNLDSSELKNTLSDLKKEIGFIKADITRLKNKDKK